ncbi:MAG: sulfite exporter TauE/SafE family protein [Candidatus Dormibacteraeota bacterium]|nr:sulfite exporter TauE/SafE family protein [Candidatus Dormibacteraeota bacterium]MBV9525489.1 sulfite exporter TauE/SafE family protein [Candidatus Dormibacteraeota bacterium]
MHVDGYVALAGLIVGFAVGTTGMGGGALMTPILVLLFRVQPLAAVSSDLVASLVMKPFGAAVHVRSRTVQWRLAGWLVAGSVPSAFIGVLFLRALGNGRAVENVVSLALGSVLLVAVAAMLMKARLDGRRRTDPDPIENQALHVKRVATLTVGAVTGFVVGITSVGSGSLVIACLLFLYPRLRGSQLVGTDLTQAIPMVGAAALAHVLFGDFHLGLTLSILAGSIPGVLAGSLLSARSASLPLRAALGIVLLVSGLKLLNVPTPAVGAAFVVASAALLTVAAYRNRAWVWVKRSAVTPL